MSGIYSLIATLTLNTHTSVTKLTVGGEKSNVFIVTNIVDENLILHLPSKTFEIAVDAFVFHFLDDKKWKDPAVTISIKWIVGAEFWLEEYDRVETWQNQSETLVRRMFLLDLRRLVDCLEDITDQFGDKCTQKSFDLAIRACILKAIKRLE